MKRLILAAALALSAPFAQAAKPTDAQVDALLEVMNLSKTHDDMLAQMEGPMRQVAVGAIPAEMLDDAQRAKLDAFLKRQHDAMRAEMTWDKMAPMYRRIYADIFTDAEILAMTKFYATPEGRSIMAKMPQTAARSMQEVQPMLAAMMQRMMADLQKELPAPKN